MKALCIAAALVVAAGGAAAQNRTTELQARSYIQSAFITGVAHAILSDDVALDPELRERLALPAGADRNRIYEAIFGLTEDRPLRVRKSSAQEAAGLATRSAGRPVFVLEGGAAPLLVVYDLDRNAIAFVALIARHAAAGGTPAPAFEPKPLRVAHVTRAIEQRAAVPMVMRLKPIAFDFSEAALASDAKAQLEREGLPKIVEIREVRYIVHGHADRLGSRAYNQRLSERRAQAVRDYLIERGVPQQLIETAGLGSSMPLANCEQKQRRALIECLAPDRRVTVEIQPPPM